MLTDMNEALVNNTDFNNWLMGRIPSKRWGRPDELVGAAIFLASDAPTTSTARSSMSMAA